MSRKKLLESLECCVQNDACDRCPMMEEICDYPFVPFTQLPVPLVVAVMEELKEQEKKQIVLKKKHVITWGRNDEFSMRKLYESICETLLDEG